MSLSPSHIRPFVAIGGVIICTLALVFRSQYCSAVRSAASTLHVQSTVKPTIEQTPVPHTVDDRLQEYGDVVRARLEPDFQRAGMLYPPASLALLMFKQEKRMDIYASGKNGAPRFIRSYPVLAASGHAGPKLREGDLQVPEGLYRIESLNSNSLFHLSLRVNYPNEFDRANAVAEQRDNLGGDIMIHGNAVSIGCMAMGDEAAEDLFVLAALIGIEKIRVVLSPVDFRRVNLSAPEDPSWLAGLYEQIRNELHRYPVAQPARN